MAQYEFWNKLRVRKIGLGLEPTTWWLTAAVACSAFRPQIFRHVPAARLWVHIWYMSVFADVVSRNRIRVIGADGAGYAHLQSFSGHSTIKSCASDRHLAGIRPLVSAVFYQSSEASDSLAPELARIPGLAASKVRQDVPGQQRKSIHVAADTVDRFCGFPGGSTVHPSHRRGSRTSQFAPWHRFLLRRDELP